MTAATDPAHRHGGPGAGWYRPGPDGWLPVRDADVWQYPDAVRYGHDPREDGPMSQCPVPAVPQPPAPLIIKMHRDLSADEVDGLRRKIAAALAQPWHAVVLPPDTVS